MASESAIPPGWSEVRLDEFLTLQRGHDLPKRVRQPGGVPVLGASGRVGWHNDAVVSGPSFTIGRAASIGNLVWEGQDFWPLNTTLYVTEAHGNDLRFAYYLLHTVDFQQYDSGSVQPMLNRNYVAGHRLVVPRVDEQRAIAEVLGSFDDALEQCWSDQLTIRATAQALFRQSFSGGIETALTEIVDVAPGRSYKSAELDDGSDVGLVNLKNIPRHGGFVPGGTKGYTGKYRDAQIVHSGDLVVACTDVTQQGDVIGRCGRVRPSPSYSTLVASMDLAVVRPKVAWLSSEYLYEILSTPEYVEHAKRYVNGTTVLHMKKVAIADYITTIPSPDDVKRFTETVRPMWELHDRLDAEAATLAELRDTLLPELLSGRLRIDNPERLLADVTP